MVVASSYPFLGVLWSMLVFFLWVSWFVLLFHVIGDVFRRDDASGWNKTLWLIFVVLVPFIGVFAYLIANNEGMAQRSAERAEAQGAYYAPSAAGDPVADIERAKKLLDTGAITQAEFDAIKTKALG
jgi:hypothetical protein